MLGFFIGGFFGFLIASLLKASSDADDKEYWSEVIRLESLYNEQRRQNEILLNMLNDGDDGK